MDFHEKLQELRKRRGLTQDELAMSLYVSRTAISKWESGRGYPSIDSLRAIARFFSVTVDELLSSDELLSAAEENQKFTETHLRELMLGVLDLGMSLLLFLPLFAVRTGDAVQAASLLSLEGMALYLRIAYWIASIGAVILGVLMLALQNCEAPAWRKSGMPLSVLWSVGAVLLFVLGLHPYAAVFSFVLLVMKALMLIKRR
ncbi:MAG: helix-turn-helix transcriptional regulator [Clostridia bacterium]|nr:helix-turn-helix transcriptional regulator [Clostridia bacterium]